MKITVNGMEYSDMKAAAKAAKKVEKAERAAQAVIDENQRFAYLNAYKALYGVAMIAQSQVDETTRWTKRLACKPNMRNGSSNWYVQRYTTEGGTVYYEHLGIVPDSTLLSGSGGDLAVYLLNLNYPDSSGWYAIGIHADQIAFVEIPGIIANLLVSIEKVEHLI